MSKSRMFVGKGDVSNGLFKLNVMTVKPKIMNKTNASFVSVLESSNLWHGKLRHVNYGSLKRLINLNHIPTFQIDIKHKCETCVEAKMTGFVTSKKKKNLLVLLFYLIVLYTIINFILFICYFISFK